MNQAQVSEMVSRFVQNGMSMVQALATAMAFVKVAELKAAGHECTQPELALIAHNAKSLAEDVIARQQAAQGEAFLSVMGA